MAINVLPANDENFAVMKGQEFVPQEGEGIVYIKLVAIKPATMKDGDPKGLVDGAQGVLVCGQMSEINAKLAEWFAQTAEEYTK